MLVSGGCRADDFLCEEMLGMGQQFSVWLNCTVILERSGSHRGPAKTRNPLLRRLIEHVAGLFFVAVAGDSEYFLPFHRGPGPTENFGMMHWFGW